MFRCFFVCIFWMFSWWMFVSEVVFICFMVLVGVLYILNWDFVLMFVIVW